MPQVALTREEAKAIGPHNQEAVHKFIRRARNPELYIGLSDDLVNVADLQPSTELKIRFETVFDSDQRRNLKLIMHPLFKRWTILERTWHRGQPLWQFVCMFHDTPIEDQLPSDYKKNAMLFHLKGKVGEHREVTYQDLEFVEKCDFYKYGVAQVDEFLAQFDEKANAELDKQLEDRLDDFLDYNFWLAMRDAQAHYSQPWSTRTVELKSDTSRYHIEQKNGYKVRTRLWGEEGDMNEMKAAVEGRIDFDSASGKAIQFVLERKNRKYKEKYGESLWERVTGGRVIWADYEDSRPILQEQTKELVSIAEASDVEVEEHMTVEEWLKQSRARQFEKVPV